MDMDMGAGYDPLTIAEGVAEFVVLAELSTALSERLVGWSTDGADPDSSAVMASLGARLAEHSTWWTERGLRHRDRAAWPRCSACSTLKGRIARRPWSRCWSA